MFVYTQASPDDEELSWIPDFTTVRNLFILVYGPYKRNEGKYWYLFLTVSNEDDIEECATALSTPSLQPFFHYRMPFILIHSLFSKYHLLQNLMEEK